MILFSLTFALICGVQSSDAEIFTDGDCEFEYDMGLVWLNAFNDFEATEFTVPDTANYKGTPYPVIGINKSAIPTNVQIINIPNNVFEITPLFLSLGSELTTINVSPSHEAFMIQNEALINKINKKVIAYPPANPQTEIDLTGTKVIGEYSFTNAENLVSVLLDEGTVNISMGAFYGCSNLKYIRCDESDMNNTLPDSLLTIQRYSFMYCTSLNVITIGSSIKMLPLQVFNGCTALTTVNLNSDLYFIDPHAFYDCSSLKTITVENNAYYYVCEDPGLEGILMRNGDDNKRYISLYPGGYERETLEIDRTVNGIDSCAFAFGIGKLKNVHISMETTEITAYSFQNCVSLESLYTDSIIIRIGEHAFDGCTSLNKMDLGRRVVSIGDYAFQYCTLAKEMTFPDTVSLVGNYAFRFTGIEKLTIGEVVEYIGNGAFEFSDLKDVTIEGRPTVGDAAFNIDGDLHILKHTDYNIPGDAFGTGTKVTYDSLEEWKFPMYNVIGIIVCVALLIGMIALFRKI